MSRLRQKAHATKDHGAMLRRNWDPDPNSAHYKLYAWWQRKSGDYRARENFCHYWRVVVFWAPLYWLIKPLLGLLAVAFVSGVVTFCVLQSSAAVGIVTACAFLAFIFVGIGVAAQLASELNSDLHWQWPWLDRRSNSVKALLTILTLPIVLTFGALMVTVCAFGMLAISLHEDYNVYRKIGKWFASAQFSDRPVVKWLRPWQVFLIALIVLAFPYDSARVILSVIAGWTVAAAIFVFVAYMIDSARQRKQKKLRLFRETQLQRQKCVTDIMLHRLFAILHPMQANDAQRYAAWFKRYNRYCHGDVYGMSVYFLFLYTADRYRQIYGMFPWDSESPVIVKVQQSKLRLLALGIGDFFVLLWSIVLTRKWRICPIVELPK